MLPRAADITHLLGGRAYAIHKLPKTEIEVEPMRGALRAAWIVGQDGEGGEAPLRLRQHRVASSCSGRQDRDFDRGTVRATRGMPAAECCSGGPAYYEIECTTAET
jgi:hypothetical protein